MAEELNRLASQGKTPMYMALDGEFLGKQLPILLRGVY